MIYEISENKKTIVTDIYLFISVLSDRFLVVRYNLRLYFIVLRHMNYLLD